MCYRTQLNSKIKEIEKTFDARFIAPEEYHPQEEINAFDFASTPVITDESLGEIQFYQWGLVPFWAKDDRLKKNTLNARIETIEEKPSFRDAAKQRCLVLSSGYYEWQWLDPKGKKKQKYFIKPETQDLFAFAGIYSHWKDPGSNQLVSSYSIVTTTANELMSKIHNNKKRMPVVLRKEDQSLWLSGRDSAHFSFPYEVELAAKPV